MSKGYRAVYDGKGMAYEYINGECTFVREDLKHYTVPSSCAPAVRGDTPDIVSSIDGSIISGRRAMREHCLKHNVLPIEETKGLPPLTMNREYQLSKQEREATKRTMADIINSRGY